MSKKNTETTTKEVEIEKNEADEVDFGFDSVTKKPSKIKQAGEWALVIGGVAVIAVAVGIAATAVLNRLGLINCTENESDDHHALEDDYYDEETDTYVEVNATENETPEE